MERTRALLEKINDGSFKEWRDLGVEMSMWPDANGLRIDAGPAGERGVHSHIPYRNIYPEILTRLRQDFLLIGTDEVDRVYELQDELAEWINDGLAEEGLNSANNYLGELLLVNQASQIELEIRVAEATHATDQLPQLYDTQNLAFAAAARRGHMDPREKDTLLINELGPETTAIRYLFCYTDAIKGEINKSWSSTQFHLPKPTIQRYIQAEADTSEQARPWDSAELAVRLDDLISFLDAANAGVD